MVPGLLPEADVLMAEARRISGIALLDGEARLPLSMLVAALNAEGRLHAAGADAMRARLLRILANRLRMRRDILEHPEILDEQIQSPIVICGMGRTGSTKLQKLLAASGDFNWLPYWQAFMPSLITGDRAEAPQARIDETEAYVQYLDRMSPDMKYGHQFLTHQPEEESMILEHSLMSPTALGWAPISSYLDWLMRQNLDAQFMHLRDTLKYLQWQGLANPARRWVLKSPLYAGLEPNLLRSFPDATLVMTHRHPAETMASGLRLLECFYQPFSSAKPDVTAYVAAMAAALEGHLDCRAALPEVTFLDIHLNELIRDASSVVRKVYGFARATLPDESLGRMIAWDKANPQHKHGKLRYDLEYFGLSPEEIDLQFTRYVALLTTHSASFQPDSAVE